MPAPALLAPTEHADRDRFRSAVTALPPGPLRDVLTAVAYARDAAARTGTGAAPHDRWQAVVAVAERAIQYTEPTPRRARERRSSADVRTARAARHRTPLHPGRQEVGVR
jgi:hypothetical protein